MAPDTFRWTARRKLELVKALVHADQTTRQAVQQQYGISDEELAEWLQRYGSGDVLQARARLRASDMSLRWGGRSRKLRRMAAARGQSPRDAAD